MINFIKEKLECAVIRVCGMAKKFCMPDGMPFAKAHTRHARWHAFKPHDKYIYFDWSIIIPYFPGSLFSGKIDFGQSQKVAT